MNSVEEDDEPMLWDTHINPYKSRDVEQPEFTVRSRSASMSRTQYTGNLLASERRTPAFVHMSGPLYTNQKPDSISLPIKGLTAPPTSDLALEYPSFKNTDEKDSPNDNFSGTNEHLMKSGPLGMCNDPYCTTCPTYNKAAVAKLGISKPQSDLRVIFLASVRMIHLLFICSLKFLMQLILILHSLYH